MRIEENESLRVVLEDQRENIKEEIQNLTSIEIRNQKKKIEDLQRQRDDFKREKDILASKYGGSLSATKVKRNLKYISDRMVGYSRSHPSK